MHIYFLGICGAAMGNAALLLRAIGHTVSGSDTGVYPPMSDMLRGAGITILEGWDAARLAALRPDLVVVGNVASRGHPEVEWLLETRAIPYVSLPELLRLHVLNRRQNLVVSGTHGKTTTTCLAAALLRANGADPGWLVGGVPRDIPGGAAPGHDGGPFVIEGDEYDTAFFDKRSKFIQYLPSLLLINNIEFDHADIFRDLPDVLRTFSHVTRVVPRNGAIIANGDDANVAQVTVPVTWCPVVRVGIGADNDTRIVDFSEDGGSAAFSLLWRGALWAEVRWTLPGLFNARNAAMAATAAALALYPAEPTRLSLGSLAGFQGVKRRQEKHVSTDRLVVLEDFGHHPTAIKLTLESLRRRYPQHFLHAAFEPRSNTAVRRVLQDAFTEALAVADSAWLAPVHRGEKYAAADRLDTVAIAGELTRRGRHALSTAGNQALLEGLLEATSAATPEKPHLVVFFSNGDFGGIIRQFTEAVVRV
ncbi:MAG: Mur ligase domain-containing protein [Puniceicoccales bacterium]|jgi:UDP-N-acetylmuramate: L-alanyl-gamma-D-glutamyl-meso-diaminopimelate ligase|nr:Mur ligase domain-containing protein [Puniceicoccales bacterium]